MPVGNSGEYVNSSRRGIGRVVAIRRQVLGQTRAPATAAPFGSVMVPGMEPKLDWAQVVNAKQQSATSNAPYLTNLI